LSAGHCFGLLEGYNVAENWIAVAGLHNMTSVTTKNYVTENITAYDIASIDIHPQYTADDQFKNDIAILTITVLHKQL
jgi:hypothetical protein